jgi:type II secretory pathway component GspD/PulD (secretin)
VLRIEEAATPQPPPATAGESASTPDIFRELSLSHLDSAGAADLLNGLYPTSLATGTRSVQFAGQPSTNSVVLSGPADKVNAAAAALARADRAPRHVVIEALVIEFDANALEQVGLDLSGGAKGNFGGVASGFGSLLSRALTFNFASSARNSLAFTAALEALAADDKARLISRPYLAALSGKPASIQITNDRYVIVESAQDGASVATATPIQSGITLNITPTIGDSGVIRMDITVEDSQFIPTVANVAVEVDKNQASTTMLVESGQSISIGGLFLNRDTWSNSGLPVLRDIPGLNLLFGKRKRERENQEVIIFITPHIWQPGVDSPLTFDEQLDRKAPQ